MKTKNNPSVLINRINDLCRERGLTYYELSYRSAVPLTTLLHIMNGSTKNPGFFTIVKICDGLQISMAEFWDAAGTQVTEEYM